MKQGTHTHSDTGRVDLKQVRIRQDRQRRGKGNSNHYKQVSTVTFMMFLCLKTKQFKDTLFYEASLSVSKLKLVGGNNEWEGNIMVGGKPVCDDGSERYLKAIAQVVCRFIFFWPKIII